MVGTQWMHPSGPSTSCQFRSAMRSSGCTGEVLCGSGSTISLQAGSCTAIGKQVVIEWLFSNAFQLKSGRTVTVSLASVRIIRRLDNDNSTIPKTHLFPHIFCIIEIKSGGPVNLFASVLLKPKAVVTTSGINPQDRRS